MLVDKAEFWGKFGKLSEIGGKSEIGGNASLALG